MQPPKNDDPGPTVADAPAFRSAGALLDAVDWSNHPIGARELWSMSLQNTLRVMLASAESMYLVWGEHRTFFFNDAYAPILGPRISVAMGASFEELWADAYPSVEGMFLKALQGRSSRVINLPIRMARWGKPEDTWWTLSFNPVFGDDGTVAGALCLTNETTAMIRQAESEQRALTALVQSERSLRRAQEAGRVGIFEIDIASSTLTGSPEFFRLFGLPPMTTVAAKDVEALVVPEDAALISNDQTRASQDLNLHAEYRIRRRDTGEIRVIDRRGELEFDAVGTPVRLLGVVQDITERREARDELAALNASLEATVADRTKALLLHEHIIQSDVTPICAFDTDYRLIAFNKAHNDEFRRVNGFDTKLGDVFCDLFVPEQQPVMRALMTRALTGESFTVEEEFGNPVIDAPCWEIHYSPLRDESGKVIGAFHHARDISSRRRAAIELEVAQEALRHAQKMEGMGQLTGGVAHDFNNLLTPIIGSLDLISRKTDFSAREARLIDGALQSAERAKTLVQRLLAFARRQPLQSEPIDLAHLIGGITDLVASTCGPQILVQTAITAGLPPAQADANQLEMAILNLCVNARDAMPDGGTITIAADRGLGDGGFVRLSVIDTGTGMDEETARRAIEPFYSTKGIGKGTGLGLSMVHGLASQLGGSLEIATAPDQGTRIHLLLPISESAAPTPAQPAPSDLPTFKGRALIVDDEPLVRMTTADMMQALGYETIEVADAAQALQRLSEDGRFDVVVTDHLMPGTCGAELAGIIHDRWPGLPILVVSGYAEAHGLPPSLPLLNKPFREAELADALARLAWATPPQG